MPTPMDFSQKPYHQVFAPTPWAVSVGMPLAAQAEVQDLVQAQLSASRDAEIRIQHIELLSQRLSRHLAPEVWRRLFHGSGKQSITFDQQTLGVLFIESLNLGGCDASREPLAAIVDRVARQHGGTVDSFGWGGTALFFTNVFDAVRTALDLMTCATELRMRMGVHSCNGVVASFRSGGQVHSTLLGTATDDASTVSGAAAYGTVGLSSAAQGLLQARIDLPLTQAEVPAWLCHEAAWAFERSTNGSLRLIPTNCAGASS